MVVGYQDFRNPPYEQVAKKIKLAFITLPDTTASFHLPINFQVRFVDF